MIIYCLFSTETTSTKNSTTVNLLLEHDAAVAEMRAAYERKLAMLPFDVSLQTDWHRCSCENDLARIIDGAGSYTGCVQ